jgi:hypothetical protein
MATDKDGIKLTFRIDGETLLHVRAVMLDRGILKLSDFLRQAIAGEIRRWKLDSARYQADMQTLRHQGIPVPDSGDLHERAVAEEMLSRQAVGSHPSAPYAQHKRRKAR